MIENFLLFVFTSIAWYVIGRIEGATAWRRRAFVVLDYLNDHPGLSARAALEYLERRGDLTKRRTPDARM